ncbi:MAG TPA: tRNA (N6-threonylcarbamoyladenosine(37)-N6)-methyltransferase TrmO [Morganella sp. (in: Bacteria)]|nr:tRNA (N6-threonylcarbamoyladenosine(37)-N6)-methyltransferase TrmO [Morganella sp. (in: enterobacteria)]
MSEFSFSPIGFIRSPWQEKFAIPRQPGLVEDGTGELHFVAPYNHADCVRGLEQFSHVWVIFVFHEIPANSWRPLVRPPRLGGNAKLGVFATRSTYRPNPVGMSLVRLNEIHYEGETAYLSLGSLDLLNGTPVLDIKPYLPYAESVPDAQAGFAQEEPAADMPVIFSSAAQHFMTTQSARYPDLARFITQVLAQDPRPAYKKQQTDDKIYAVHLLDFDVRWQIRNGVTEVISLENR